MLYTSVTELCLKYKTKRIKVMLSRKKNYGKLNVAKVGSFKLVDYVAVLQSRLSFFGNCVELSLGGYTDIQVHECT